MAEIILGAKRPPRSRRIARRLVLAAAIGLVAVAIGYVGFRRATTYPLPSGTVPDTALTADGTRLSLGASSLERLGELWILRLSGAGFELGATEARLLGAAARDADGVLDPVIVGEDPPSGFSGTFHDARLRWRFRLLADGLPDARRDEIAGLSAGLRRAGIAGAPSYQQLVWRQAALDLGAPPGAQMPGGVAGGLAFALGGPGTGKIVVGRSFGLPGAAPPGAPVVAIVRSPSSITYARIGWAGEVGTVTGVNAENLTVIANLALTQDVRPDLAAEPVTLLARDLLEKAHTLEEAVTMLQAAHPLGSASFLIVDGKSNGWAVVERSPAKTVVSRPKTPPVIGDYLAAAEFAKDADNDRARRTRRGGGRVDRVAELLARQPVPPPEPGQALALLRDRKGLAAPGNGSSVDDLDQAHVVIIDAGAMLMWVAEGPGAAGPFRVLDLRHELLGEPIRVPAPAALPADATVDLAAARAVVLGRVELRAAARRFRRGLRQEAEDGVARALALAPDLAEAHKLAGDLARAAGDDARAAEHYRRFLELIPGDAGAEQEVRAYLGGP